MELLARAPRKRCAKPAGTRAVRQNVSMSAIINLVCLSFLASLPSAFAGPPSDLPFEQLVGNSDLIVIGRVATKDGPKTCHLRLPHTKDQVDAVVEPIAVTGATRGLPRWPKMLTMALVPVVPVNTART